MPSAVAQLMALVDTPSPYDIAADDLRETQIAAMDERFQSRRAMIRLLAHRAEEAGLDRIASFDDAVKLLFPHTAYKSYPESFLIDRRWDRFCKWLDTVSTHRVPPQDKEAWADIDQWLDHLESQGVFVSCSSGTTGKSAMLVASQADIDWWQREAVKSYSWGSGVAPAQDRRMFGMAAVARTARATGTGKAYHGAYQRPDVEPFAYPVPPITVGGLTGMVAMRKKIADGTATPEEIAEMERVSAERQQAVDDAVGITARAVVAARGDKLHVTGLWAGLYNVARAVRDMGYSAKDFHPENSIYVGGGLKRAVLPDDYREFVYETFNIAPERNYQNYSMQELHSAMPRCREGGRYHVPPWVVPLILDKPGEALLPREDGEYEGRAAFFDLSIDGRWGGVISGDKVSIDFRPCACGAKGASIRDNVVRYADLEGDDKIGCAGTVDAYVRGVTA